MVIIGLYECPNCKRRHKFTTGCAEEVTAFMFLMSYHPIYKFLERAGINVNDIDSNLAEVNGLLLTPEIGVVYTKEFEDNIRDYLK